VACFVQGREEFGKESGDFRQKGIYNLVVFCEKYVLLLVEKRSWCLLLMDTKKRYRK
jgi:hypothetical protein